ncbi:MAG: glycosyltransferase family 39 protein [Candidatus Limivicinus sp.]|nr:glycosyltransferase family 39 protein [Candidatus Limivicinus sp.]
MANQFKRKGRWLCAGLLLIMFIVGLAVTGDYGIPTDEGQEIDILLANMREYLEYFFPADSALMYALDEARIVSISRNIEMDHGQSAYYGMFPLLFAKYGIGLEISNHQLSQLYHLYTYFVCFSAVICMYWLGKELFVDERVAILGAVLLFVSPRFFGEMHYNNKDLVLLCLLVDTCCVAVRATRRKKLSDVLLFGLTAALVSNTKIVGLFFFGMMGLAYIVYVSLKKQWNRKSVVRMLTAILSFAFFYVLLTPAMWPDPSQYFLHLLSNAFQFSRWHGQILFEGAIFDPVAGELPRRYLIKLIYLTTPLFILGLAAVGVFELLHSFCGKGKILALPERVLFTAACLCALVPLLVAVATGSLVYNGWRHFYFSYFGVILLAALGVALLLGWKPKLAGICLGALIAANAVGLALEHPNQYAYYNVLVSREGQLGYETDYWGLSTREALETILAQDEREQINVSWGEDCTRLCMICAYSRMKNSEANSLWLEPDQSKADYILLNVTKGQEYGYQISEDFSLVATIESYGLPLTEIYQRSNEKGETP